MRKNVAKKIEDEKFLKVQSNQDFVQLTDFSLPTVLRGMWIFLVITLLLLIFPYRSLTKQQASYDLLLPFYFHKAGQFFGFSEKVLPQVVSKNFAQGVPAIMYHGVMYRPDHYNIERSLFEEHMRVLYEAGWQTITMDELRSFLKDQIELPEKSFLLTFDDGRKDSYYPVDPLLEKFGFSAVMFTLPQYSIDYDEISPYYLNRDQIAEMIETGRWDIESHSWDAHSYFPTEREGEATGIFFANLLWHKERDRQETPEEFRLRVRSDLQRADQSIRNFNGNSVSAIAFPFGNYGAAGHNFVGAADIVLEEASAVHDFGITQVRNSIFRGHGVTYNYPQEEGFLLRRVDVNPLWSGRELIQVLEGGMTKSLPFQAAMENFVGWVANTGVLYHGENGVVFETIGESDRVHAFLDGGSLWEDYSYRVHLDWISGDRVELISREYFDTERESVVCVYEHDRMFATVGGAQIEGSLLLYRQRNIYGKKDLEMSLFENTGSCRIGTVGVSFDLPRYEEVEYAQQGTVGLQFVAGEDVDARGVVYEIAVEPTTAETFK